MAWKQQSARSSSTGCKAQGLVIHISEGEYQTVLGLVGDTTNVDMDLIASLGHRRQRSSA